MSISYLKKLGLTIIEDPFNLFGALYPQQIHDVPWHAQDPFDPVRHPSYQVPSLPNLGGIDRKTAGAGLIVFGTGMLLPGPLDLVVAAAGAYAGGPAGAVGAVALYNITAVGLIVVGYLMVTY